MALMTYRTFWAIQISGAAGFALST